MKTSRKNGKNGKTTEQIYAEVTQRIVAALEEDVVPWHRPWRVQGGHIRMVPNKPYRGINQWLLELTAMERGYASPYWLTFKQAKEMSDKLDPETYRGVRKGEESTMVVLWKPLLVDDENNLDEHGKPAKKKIWMIRAYSVFNLEQTDLPMPEREERTFEPIEEAERVYSGMKNRPPLKHGGDRAFYHPAQDRVQLPLREDMDTPEDYYSTQFHELGHATGHESRLNRPEVANGEVFDDREIYSKEELTAEMTAAMICGFVGIDLVARHETTVAYINSWMSKLGKDPKLVASAASKAHAAADYILGIEKEENGE